MTTNKEKYSGYFHCDLEVRKNKSITDISKLVFGDIAYFYFLGNGKCIATNSFFSKKYGKSEGTISNAISKLVNMGYIKRFLDEYKNRTIYVNRTAFAKDQVNGDLDNQLNNIDNSPISDSQSPAADAPLTLENQQKMEEYYKKKFPNILNLDNDGAVN